MKSILRSILGGFVAAFFAVVAQAADLAPGAFSAGTVKGDVTYKLAGTTQYIALTAGTALPQGATVKTGPSSLAIIVFGNGATASIRPNSVIEVTKFQQEAFSGAVSKSAEPSVSNTEIKVIDGSVVSKVAKLKKGSSYVVKSPVGAAGVRGTVFIVTYNAATGAYNVATQEGVVVFSKTGAGGDEIEIRAGQSYAGSDVAPLTAEQIATIEAAIAGELEKLDGNAGGNGGNGPTTGPTFPDIDTSIPVSTN